jgi:hypothetical protein
VSTDDGATWTQKSEGIVAAGNGSATQMAIHDGYIYALFQAFVQPGSNYGLYRRSLSELGFAPASAPREPDAGGIMLDVAPNPVRRSASVALMLERSSAVRVAVYDALGRQVALLHDGPLDAGEHHFRWDASAPAGMYVVSAQIDGRSTARSFLRAE